MFTYTNLNIWTVLLIKLLNSLFTYNIGL